MFRRCYFLRLFHSFIQKRSSLSRLSWYHEIIIAHTIGNVLCVFLLCVVLLFFRFWRLLYFYLAISDWTVYIERDYFILYCIQYIYQGTLSTSNRLLLPLFYVRELWMVHANGLNIAKMNTQRQCFTDYYYKLSSKQP